LGQTVPNLCLFLKAAQKKAGPRPVRSGTFRSLVHHLPRNRFRSRPVRSGPVLDRWTPLHQTVHRLAWPITTILNILEQQLFVSSPFTACITHSCLEHDTLLWYREDGKWGIQDVSVVTHTSSPSNQNFTYCRHSYNDLIMKVSSLPSLPPPRMWHHFQINPYFSLLLSTLLVLLYLKFTHSWKPQNSFHLIQNLTYESWKFAIPPWQKMGSLNSLDLGNWYANVSHSSLLESALSVERIQ